MYSQDEIRFFNSRSYHKQFRDDYRFCDKLLEEEHNFIVDRNSQNDLMVRGQEIPLTHALNGALLPYQWLTLEINRDFQVLADTDMIGHKNHQLVSKINFKDYPNKPVHLRYRIEKIHFYYEQKNVKGISSETLSYLEEYFDLYRYLENKSLKEILYNKQRMIRKYGHHAIEWWNEIDSILNETEKTYKYDLKGKADPQGFFKFDYLKQLKKFLDFQATSFRPAQEEFRIYDETVNMKYFIFYIQYNIGGKTEFTTYRFTESQPNDIWQMICARSNNLLINNRILDTIVVASSSLLRDIERNAFSFIKGFFNAYKNKQIEETTVIRSVRVPRSKGSRKTRFSSIECKSLRYNSELGSFIEPKVINATTSESTSSLRKEVTPHTRRACLSYIWVLEKNVKPTEVWHDIKEINEKIYVKVLRHRRSSQVKGGSDVRGTIRCN